MKRKLLALSLAFGLLLTLCSAVFAAEQSPRQTFPDVPANHWAFDYVEDLVRRGAIGGYPDGKFYPNQTVTREEFAKIMVVAAGLTPSPAQVSTYADVPLTHWSSPYIETARPYMTAYRKDNQLYFYPSNGALREDMAVAVVKLRGYDPAQANLGLLYTMFSDYTSISEVTRPYVALAVEHGIINGYDDGTFRGQGTITRAEAAAILYRAFQKTDGDKVIPDDILPPTPTPSPTASPEVTPTPTPKPTPEPSPEPSPEPETPQAVPAVGYILSTPYITRENGVLCTSFTLWNGTENISVRDKAASTYPIGTSITYLNLGNGWVEQVTPVTNVGAIIAWDGVNTIKLNDSDKEFQIGNTTIIFIDSYAKRGISNGILCIADYVDPDDPSLGRYPNVFYQLSEDGTAVEILFVDINNRLEGANPI